jgi:hypothetical protein
MIDFEVKIFNKVHTVVAPLCAPKGFVSKQIVKATAFPAASLIEMDNTTVRDKLSSTPRENFALITYQLDVFAMKKSECRAVFAAADDMMLKLNFSRMGGRYIDNPGNPDVFRYTARYEAVVDPDGNIYRRP